jgi:O-acetyl-ADP-ribose deacetylase (regulator of RNase III)
MLTFVDGDLFAIGADILVNAVNCRGVMGAGIALTFKDRYPAMFRAYKIACDAGRVAPGRLDIWKRDGEWIVNLPTKRHWRDRSKYDDVAAGLVALRAYLAGQGRVKVALPALGCGRGGLDWTTVSAMIREHLSALEADIVVFGPSDATAPKAAKRAQSAPKAQANRK